MNIMTCTTCNRVVYQNNTGICLSCQKGFSESDGSDIFLDYSEDIARLQRRKQEVEDAIEKGIQPEDD